MDNSVCLNRSGQFCTRMWKERCCHTLRTPRRQSAGLTKVWGRGAGSLSILGFKHCLFVEIKQRIWWILGWREAGLAVLGSVIPYLCIKSGKGSRQSQELNGSPAPVNKIELSTNEKDRETPSNDTSASRESRKWRNISSCDRGKGGCSSDWIPPSHCVQLNSNLRTADPC